MLSALDGHRTAFVFRADRVEVDVLDELPGVEVGLDEVGLEAALEEMPAALVPAIEADAVGGLEPADRASQVGAGCLEQKVIVVVRAGSRHGRRGRTGPTASSSVSRKRWRSAGSR